MEAVLKIKNRFQGLSHTERTLREKVNNGGKVLDTVCPKLDLHGREFIVMLA